jgi:hypothetical protein
MIRKVGAQQKQNVKISRKCNKCRHFTHKECLDQVCIKGEYYQYCLFCTLNEQNLNENKDFCNDSVGTTRGNERRNEDNCLNRDISFEQPSKALEQSIVFQHTEANLLKCDTSAIINEESFDDMEQSMDVSFEENYENGTNSETVPVDVKDSIIAELTTNIKSSLQIDEHTRDRTVHALAIITKTIINEDMLDDNKASNYIRNHQNWFIKKNEQNCITNKNFKLLATITNNDSLFKKRVKKGHLRILQSNIVRQFCDAKGDELKKFKSISLLASISGIYVEADTFKKSLKNDLVTKLKTCFNQEKFQPVFDLFSINIVNAHINEQQQKTKEHLTMSVQAKPVQNNQVQVQTRKSKILTSVQNVIRLEVRLNMVALSSEETLAEQLKRQLQYLVDN